MAIVGSKDNPLRVAVIGCGPSGFYVAQTLLTQKDLAVTVDMLDRLPSPYGLVRYGVAPDHQKMKAVTKVYAKIASDRAVRWFGSVEFGKHVTLDELKARYHAVAFTTGAQTDRRLGIPGEDLVGSHPATEFVAWYNGHPDYRHLTFDLGTERAVVIGVGNVAIDVARMLCRTPEELAKTDIADYALETLRKSRVKEVLLVGRRGPAQAAFTNSEVEELEDMEGADAVTLPEEMALDDVSREELAAHPDRLVESKVAQLNKYALPRASARAKRLVIRFLLSPTEIRGENGRVTGIRLVRNALTRGKDGSVKATATDRFEDVPTGLVFRSGGYRGVALPGVPFRDDWGTIPHEQGRVTDLATKQPVPGLYAAGWIKRGPSGVIGTNRGCAVETVRAMLEDLRAGSIPSPQDPSRDALPALLERKGVRWISFDQWSKVESMEVARGEPSGRPRVKFVSEDEILRAIASGTPAPAAS
ncbi:MAG TPA: FAD-dependent oxidoreductase [Planctomycetota bacterium]|nr:FAD-dependent oxidoreductase [Planctomycetota bacterium]